MNPIYDVIIVGGGIVGLASAYQILQQKPGVKLALLEKEIAIAKHQSGRNSGVIHSGIYYKPGSFKANNCREGRQLLIEFCQQFSIPFEICGKLIVATSPHEFHELEKLTHRAKENGISVRQLEQTQIRELEPHCAGLKGIHVHDAGIVDFPRVCQVLCEQIKILGGEVHLNCRVEKLIGLDAPDDTRVLTSIGEFQTKTILTCAGLQSDRLLNSTGHKNNIRIIPFRGEYFKLKPESSHLCKHLIYPVPDPQFPFLGLHFTRMIHGGIECGPNAVWSFSREGYHKGSFNLRDTIDALAFTGFRKMALKHWKMGLEEWHRSLSIHAFTKSLQRLIPEIKAQDLIPATPGHRAQALQADGILVDDFITQEFSNIIHLTNAPSPAATACLSLGKRLASTVVNKLK
jgi:L-2-hydroxyglutarate oxidase